MVLYIEYVIIDNLIIDYILLSLLSVTFKDDFKKRSMLVSSLIGTISAIFLPYLTKYNLLLTLYKILTAMIMILVLKKYKTYRKYFLYLIVFILYTFLFGGIGIGILNTFNIDYTINGLLLYSCEFPVSLFIVIFWLGSWLLKKVVICLNQQLKFNKYLYKIQLSDKGNIIEGVGFYDSGNTIKRDGRAVSIISIDMFLKLHKEYSIEKLIFRNIDSSILTNPGYIDVKSIATSTKYFAFTIDKMIINNCEHENVDVAVALKNFNSFDCIINSNFL